MPRKRLTYPQHPNSIQDINKKFIRDFFTDGISKKTITAEKAAEWAKVVKEANEAHPSEPMTAFADYRRTFCQWYYAELLIDKKDDFDFYTALAEKAASNEKASEAQDTTNE